MRILSPNSPKRHRMVAWYEEHKALFFGEEGGIRLEIVQTAFYEEGIVILANNSAKYRQTNSNVFGRTHPGYQGYFMMGPGLDNIPGSFGWDSEYPRSDVTYDESYGKTRMVGFDTLNWGPSLVHHQEFMFFYTVEWAASIVDRKPMIEDTEINFYDQAIEDYVDSRDTELVAELMEKSKNLTQAGIRKLQAAVNEVIEAWRIQG